MNEDIKTRNRMMKLEELTPEQQSWILETALNSTLVDMVMSLRQEGIDTSPASLSRFIRKDREKKLLEERKEMAETVAAFAETGRDGKLREGSLEAVRQRLYERAIVSQSPEEACELYAAMVKEETRLRELDLEARKVAALEQQVRLQGVKIQVLAEQGAAGKWKRKAEVVESRPEESERAKLEVRAGLAGDPGAAGGGMNVDEEKQRLLLVLREVNEIVNRGGGSTEEKVLELRARLAGQLKEIGASLT
jgi:hypothetical protein